MVRAEDEVRTTKYCILGCQGVGKTTIWRQLWFNLSPDVYDSNKDFRRNIISSVRIATVDILGKMDMSNVELSTQLAADALSNIGEIQWHEPFDEGCMALRVARLVQTVWKDRRFLEHYENSIFFNTGVKGLVEKVESMTIRDWDPSRSDVLRINIRTHGIIEFSISGTNSSFFDLGGSRNERRKWMYVFGDEPVIVFVASLSDYNEVRYEEDSCGLSESLYLFQQVFETPMLKDVLEVVLVLNKVDIFKEKLCNKRIPLNISGQFPDAPRTFDYDTGVNWILQRYLKLVPNEIEREHLRVHVHVVDGLNENSVAEVMSSMYPPSGKIRTKNDLNFFGSAPKFAV